MKINELLLLLYPAVWLLVTLFGVRVSKDGVSPDFLRLEQSKMIRAWACLGIILHHLVQQVSVYGTYFKGPVTIFNYCGILFTSLFFFFSGYGLLTNYLSRPDYLSGFLQKRLPCVLIPFWTVNALGICLTRFVYGIRSTPAEMLSDLSGLTLLNSNGWFIIEIVILYLLFWALFTLIPKKDAALVLLCAATLLIIRYAFFREHDPAGAKAHWFRGEWWYNSTVTFIFGLLFARFRQKITSFLEKHYTAVLTAASVLFAVTFSLSIYTVEYYGYYSRYDIIGPAKYKPAFITLCAQSAACLAFTSLVILLNMRLTLRSKVLRYLGGITTELFLIHGYFVNRIFGGIRMPDPLRFGVVIICSIAFTALVSPVVGRMVRTVTSYLAPRPVSAETLEYQAKVRKKEKRLKIIRALAVCAAAAGAVTLIWLNFGRYLIAKQEYSQEIKALRSSSVGDEAYFGHFEPNPSRPGAERLPWLVIDRDDDKVCLITKEGIAGSSYHQKHEAVSWKDSDLRTMLGEKRFAAIFSRYEADRLIPVDGDLITLLTPEQAGRLFASDKDRELSITTAAQLQGTNINTMSKHHEWDMKGYRSSWWWLKGEGKEITAPIVTVDGTISLSEKAVNKPGGAVRPVIWVDIGE